MKRFTGVRVLTRATLDCDVVVYIGKKICREAFPYTEGRNYLFLSDEDDYLISMVLGMATGTDKRVFVFCEDNYIIRNISELMQIGIAKPKNLFMVVFTSGEYPEVPNTPNIFASANSQHGMLYELGFVVHNYTNQFKFTKNPLPFIKQTWERVRGPLAVLMKVDKGDKNLPDVEFSGPKELINIKEFIMDDTILGYNYTPPIGLSEVVIEE